MEILMRKKRNSVRRCGGEEDASRFCFLRVFLSACFVSAEKKMRCGGEEDAVRRRRRKGYFVSACFLSACFCGGEDALCVLGFSFF
ncbi:unnamed protein product [Trifolium pratense]|uniref:Uncharacterized protein n=1 Tax=Trifolium pratense TaxID=57577 RepID=A0ACB0JFC7_TRIPR|nr:unnamed protein product [Trifolium pratense]